MANKPEIHKNIDFISGVWGSYIFEYKSLQAHINFKDNLGSNYCADVIKYLHDTFPIIEFKEIVDESYYSNFANAISFLQAIYIQQDLIEELLYIFSCKTTKGKLKQDVNYSINREIRNELVGHPIRKLKFPDETGRNRQRLLSSTIFSNAQSIDNIAYFRYHIDNDYNSKHVTISRTDIKQRHYAFLQTYTDEIVQKSKLLLKKFKKTLVPIEKVIEKASFAGLLKLLEHRFEAFYQYDFHNKESLIKIYKKQDEHERYKIVIQDFYDDLKGALKETIDDIDIKIGEKQNPWENTEPIEFIIDFVDRGESVDTNDENTIVISPDPKRERGYQYELEKLASKADFALRWLKTRCEDNPIVMEELRHMSDNISDDLEYYCSYKYLTKLLRR